MDRGRIISRLFYPIQARYREVAEYVMSLSSFNDEKKNFFLGGADGWLIAAAIEKKVTIVTHEKNDKLCKKKIQLPVIADFFQIQCVGIIDVLRREKVTFA